MVTEPLVTEIDEGRVNPVFTLSVPLYATPWVRAVDPVGEIEPLGTVAVSEYLFAPWFTLTPPNIAP